MANGDISITKGDTYAFTVSVTDSSGNNFDLTGYTSLKFTAKDDISKTDANADITSTGTIDPVNNWQINFKLLPTDTNVTAKEYYYDIQISDGGDNVHTVVKKSSLTITDQVTIGV